MFKRILFILLFLLSAVLTLRAQEETVDHLSVPFSNSNKPGLVQVNLVNGSIHVSGYTGEEVTIESKIRTQKLKHEKKDSKKGEGMYHITALSTTLEVEEDNNIMKVETESWKYTIDISLKVPVKTSLKLSTVNIGDITVENVTGELEIENVNGDIRLTDISGSVVGNTHNGDLTVTFQRIDPDHPMAFGTFNGDVDVTFPTDLKANVKIKTEQGDIYSDFKIDQTENPVKVIEKKSHKKDGKYKVRIERAFYGSINGGGQDMQFNSFNGDIFIRKSNQ